MLEEAGDEIHKPSRVSQDLDSAPTYSLRIYSTAIINALRSVVQYYPNQDLSGSTIEVRWPYPILVHHYDALREFKSKCDAKDLNELCAREKDASVHITSLLSFLDDNIMERVRAEEKRLENGFHTFENSWIMYKPGSTVIVRDLNSKWRAMVISTVTGGIYQNQTTPWIIIGWRLEFDGTYLGRCQTDINLSKFDGERHFGTNTVFVHYRARIEHEEAEKLITYGKMYCGLLMRQCRQHTGKSVFHPYNEVRR